MKTQLFLVALLIAAPCYAKSDVWQDEGNGLGQTVEIKEFHVQECRRRYDRWGLMDIHGKIKPIPITRFIGFDESGNIVARVSSSGGTNSLRKIVTPNGQIVPVANDVEVVNVIKQARIPVRFINNQINSEKKHPDVESPKFSFCTESGEILASKFDQISPYDDHVSAVRIGNSVGFIGMDGKFLPHSKKIICQFQDGISEGLLPVCVNKRWGYVDTFGNWKVEPKFAFAKSFQNGFALVGLVTVEGSRQEKNLVTFIDKTGKQFPGKFHSAKSFEGEYAAVSILNSDKDKEPLWGLIDRTGHWVIDPKFTRIGSLVDSTRLMYDKEFVGVFYDKKMTVGPRYLRIGKFSEGLAPFQAPVSKLYGFIDRKGRVLVPAKFAFAGTFSEGLAAVRTYPRSEKEGKIGFVDRHGTFLISPSFGGSDPSNPQFNEDFVQFHDGICFIPERSYWDGKYWSPGKGYINRLGKWVGPRADVITMGFPFRVGNALVRYYPNKLANQLNVAENRHAK